MANRIRAVDEARRAWHVRRVEIGADLRTRRLLLGTTQAEVGAAIGISASEVSRRERGDAPYVGVESLTEHAAAVGLRLVITTYPTGAGVRDAGQLRYIRRFLDRVSPAFTHELEAPIPLPGDLRAIDLVLRATGCLIAVEVITRLGDIQAQLRDGRVKARDIGATRLIIVVAATHANRRALEAVRSALLGAWDLDTRRVIGRLAAGRQPERDALVMI
jgi:transcriptional regulator with XRE-family HTH domain